MKNFAVNLDDVLCCLHFITYIKANPIWCYHNVLGPVEVSFSSNRVDTLAIITVYARLPSVGASYFCGVFFCKLRASLIMQQDYNCIVLFTIFWFCWCIVLFTLFWFCWCIVLFTLFWFCWCIVLFTLFWFCWCTVQFRKLWWWIRWCILLLSQIRCCILF